MDFRTLADGVLPRGLRKDAEAILDAKRNGREAEEGFAPSRALEGFIRENLPVVNMEVIPFDRDGADLDALFRSFLG